MIGDLILDGVFVELFDFVGILIFLFFFLSLFSFCFVLFIFGLFFLFVVGMVNVNLGFWDVEVRGIDGVGFVVEVVNGLVIVEVDGGVR